MTNNSRHPRMALLPLYLELYDRALPEMRRVLDPFLAQIADALRRFGMEVSVEPPCRLAGEFAEAVGRIEQRDVDLLVTLHLAYSPSLEAVDALARTRLPLLILDTTPDFGFSPMIDPERLLYNHGVHGVMDLANMLRRRSKAFRIVAGHWRESRVLERVARTAAAAYGVRTLCEWPVLRVGPSFAGMGDFAVERATLENRLGVRFDQIAPADLVAATTAVGDDAVQAEVAWDRARYECDIDPEVHARSVRVSLGLRSLLDDGGYGAVTLNFEAFDTPDEPVSTPPFLEASKAMARGLGYAGEGDVLTAAFVGGLSRAFGRTTFTEVFCPDWEGDRLFLSHMGEMNPAVMTGRPRLVEKPFPFSPARNPAILAGAPGPGPAIFADLAPGPDDTFCLIAAPVEVVDDPESEAWRDTVRGWVRPAGGVGPFLEAYSRLGGTHHSALVQGAGLEELEAFAGFLGVAFRAITH